MTKPDSAAQAFDAFYLAEHAQLVAATTLIVGDRGVAEELVQLASRPGRRLMEVSRMDEDLQVLLRAAADDDGVTLVDGAIVRANAERRRRHRGVTVIVLVMLALAVVALLDRETPPSVLIDQPTVEEREVGNPTVYSRRLEVSVSATGALADALNVVHLSEFGPLSDRPDQVSLVLTASEPMTLDLSVDPGLGLSVRPVLVLDGIDVIELGQSVDLDPGVPTLVRIDATNLDPQGYGDVMDQPPTVAPPLPDPVTGSLSVRSEDGRRGAIVVDLVTVELTGDDNGLPTFEDIPDQELPRPDVGQAIPTQLRDGTPVWVTGLDDGQVSVVDARSTHTISGLVGWCGTLPGFIDSPGSAIFSVTGDYAFGPAPTGLPTYAVSVSADHVTVTERLEPTPRPGLIGAPRRAPLIEASVLPQGIVCQPDPQGAAGPEYVEDYTEARGWIQEGDLLVHLVDGQIVDAAAPPEPSPLSPTPPPVPPAWFC